MANRNTGAPRVKSTRVTFEVEAATRLGEVVYVVGNSAALGNGSINKAVQLNTTPNRYPVWFTKFPIQLQRGKAVEYRYFILSGGEFKRFENFTGSRVLLPRGRFRLISDKLDSKRDHTSDAESMDGSSGASSAGSASCGDDRDRDRDAGSDGGSTSGSHGHDDATSDAADVAPTVAQLEKTDNIIIASHHLPLLLHKSEETGEWKAKWNDEHLLSRKYRYMLSPHVTWVGIPHTRVPPEDEDAVTAVCARLNCHPIFLDRETEYDFDQGFCKDTLWSVLHNVIGVYGRTPTRWTEPEVQTRRWRAYMTVNRRFAQQIMSTYNNGDLVWIHGYHLLMTPRYLSTRGVFMGRVGLFLHTPFPSSEVFRTLSCRSELLNGMLAANHIGFHLFEYARHFVTACRRITLLNYEFVRGGLCVYDHGHKVNITVSHVGIEPDLLNERMRKDSIKRAVGSMRDKFGDRVIIAGVEPIHRLQGIPLKLKALDAFLTEYPSFRKRVALVQVGLGEFESTHDTNDPLSEIQSLVSTINEKFGNVVFFQHKQYLPLDERLQLWQAADVLLNTTIRDGLNLNPLEFVYAQSTKHNPGVAICSEFAGVSRVLIGALNMNPWKTGEVVRALHAALVMGREERDARHRANMEWVLDNTTTAWARRLLQDVKASADPQHKRGGFGGKFGHTGKVQIGDNLLTEEREAHMLRQYVNAEHRVIILDYGGTIATAEGPESLDPALSLFKRREKEKMTPQMFSFLKSLSADPKNTVLVVSGSGRKVLKRAFKGLQHVGLAGENGFFFKWGKPVASDNAASDSGTEAEEEGDDDQEPAADDPRGLAMRGWNILHEHLDVSWLEIAEHIMEIYSAATDGTFLIKKSSAVVWYFGGAEREFGRSQARELAGHLRGVLANFEVSVLIGAEYVEVRPRLVHKGQIVDRVLDFSRKPADFILCIGDDESDEYMFEALRRRYMSGSEDHTRRRGSSFTGPSSGTGAGAGAGAGSGGGAVSSGSGSMTVATHGATHGDVTVTTNRPRSMSSPLHAELGDEPDEGGDQPTMLRPSARGDSARGKFAVRFDVPAPTNVTRSPARSAGSPSRRSPTRSPGPQMTVPPLDLATYSSDDFGFQVWSLCVGMKTTKARFYVNDMANVERILSRLSRISDRRLAEKRHLRVRSMVDLPSHGGAAARLRSLGPGLARERSAVFTRNAPRLTGHAFPQEWMRASNNYDEFQEHLSDSDGEDGAVYF